jgi:uncharacterized protein YjbI with pentapeptide repeats
VAAWNVWRDENDNIRPNLSGADLSGAVLDGANLSWADLDRAKLRHTKLHGANLSKANLRGADLSGADLVEANLSTADLWGADLSRANLSESNLSRADLRGANLSSAHLRRANLSGAKLACSPSPDEPSALPHRARPTFDPNDPRREWRLSASENRKIRIYSQTLRVDLSGAVLEGANLWGADLSGADLSGANLSGANLQGATLVHTDLTGADLTGCRIYGVSAWGLKPPESAKQQNLIITDLGEPEVTVDNIEVAQFVYLLLHNEKIRDVIDTITSKAVLILGRFTEERKAVLDALREELRKHDYLPILFDFNVPATRDITETVSLLARMARFIIADLTDPSSIPKELEAIVPDLAVPVQPLLEGSSRSYAMFKDYWKYDWVLPVYRYEGIEALLATLAEKIIAPAEGKVKALEERRRVIEAELTKPQ